MRRTRSNHVGRSVLSGATTPNRNGLRAPAAVESLIVPVLPPASITLRFLHYPRTAPAVSAWALSMRRTTFVADLVADATWNRVAVGARHHVPNRNAYPTSSVTGAPDRKRWAGCACLHAAASGARASGMIVPPGTRTARGPSPPSPTGAAPCGKGRTTGAR